MRPGSDRRGCCAYNFNPLDPPLLGGDKEELGDTLKPSAGTDSLHFLSTAPQTPVGGSSCTSVWTS